MLQLIVGRSKGPHTCMIAITGVLKSGTICSIILMTFIIFQAFFLIEDTHSYSCSHPYSTLFLLCKIHHLSFGYFFLCYFYPAKWYSSAPMLWCINSRYYQETPYYTTPLPPYSHNTCLTFFTSSVGYQSIYVSKYKMQNIKKPEIHGFYYAYPLTINPVVQTAQRERRELLKSQPGGLPQYNHPRLLIGERFNLLRTRSIFLRGRSSDFCLLR